MIVAGDGREAPRQLALKLGHTPSLAEVDFIVGDGNELAYAHIAAFPAWPGPLTLITGAAKSGKSHLARIFADRSAALFVEPRSAEKLSKAGGAQPIVLEDVDRANYKEAALFHLLNQSMRDGRPVLMTARQGVANWPFSTDDLKSRARLAAHFPVSVSDDIQLSQMLAKLFADRQVMVEPKVIAYLVSRMERSAEEAVLVAALLDEAALQRGAAITRALAAEVLTAREEQKRPRRPDRGQLEFDLGDGPEGNDDE